MLEIGQLLLQMSHAFTPNRSESSPRFSKHNPVEERAPYVQGKSLIRSSDAIRLQRPSIAGLHSFLDRTMSREEVVALEAQSSLGKGALRSRVAPHQKNRLHQSYDRRLQACNSFLVRTMSREEVDAELRNAVFPNTILGRKEHLVLKGSTSS